jgi:hypothetical protein
MAPAFYAAGIYFCLSRIVTVFGVENSRVSAKAYPFFFISCDCVSLVLQAVGGGMSSVDIHALMGLVDIKDFKEPRTGARLLSG